VAGYAIVRQVAALLCDLSLAPRTPSSQSGPRVAVFDGASCSYLAAWWGKASRPGDLVPCAIHNAEEALAMCLVNAVGRWPTGGDRVRLGPATCCARANAIRCSGPLNAETGRHGGLCRTAGPPPISLPNSRSSRGSRCLSQKRIRISPSQAWLPEATSAWWTFQETHGN